jgi:uridine kinase
MERTETTGIRRLLELIERGRADARDRAVFVALDGRSGAGKSYLADCLLRELRDLTVVHMDDFYRELPDEKRRQLSAREGVDRFFDWPRLRAEALEPLRAGTPALFRPFDWEAGRLSEGSLELLPASVVVVEGVYSARPELEDLIDITVLMRVDEVVRRSRLATRHDDPPSLVARWEAAEDYYFDRIKAAGEFTLEIAGHGDPV